MLTIALHDCPDGTLVHLSGDSDNFYQAVADLKGAIPVYGRRFNKETKHWWVSRASGERLAGWIDLMHRNGARVVDYRKRAEEQKKRPPPPPDSPHDTLHLLPSAPDELIKAAYRCLVKLHHPDVGGDHVTMVALNKAYEQLLKDER